MSDVDPTLAAITDTYTDWLATHGADSSRGVGWHDPQMQALRFDVLALVMEGTEPVTVADFGCGTGALFDRLAARTEPPPLGGYTGYDLVPAMVETARARHTDPRARFEVGSAVTEDHDYVLASGAFTIRPGIDDDAWEAHAARGARRPVGPRAPRDRVQHHDPHAPSRPSRTSTPATPRAGRCGARRTSPARAWRCAWARRSTTSPCSSDARRPASDLARDRLRDVRRPLRRARRRLRRARPRPARVRARAPAAQARAKLGDLAVVLHPTSAQLDAAQPWLPLQRARTAPAARRYVVGTVTEEEIHVLAPRVLAQRASNVEGSLELLMLAPSALLAKRMLAYRSGAWPGAGRRRPGASRAPRSSSPARSSHIRPAAVLPTTSGPRRASRPAAATRSCSAARVFDLLAARGGRRGARRAGPRARSAQALERAFHGRPLRQTEQAWRSHLNRLARPGGS